MSPSIDRPQLLHPDACTRALSARDPRFDGVFFVGITTTRIYCRPICPARVVHPIHRRFFDSAASAEHAGFRPCLRCRPELAPGRALVDAVPRLARVAAHRIGAGALNGHGVTHLARELGVSARHLRRALEREIGVSPVELAQTHRLLLAKRLLADTVLPVTRIAFASGFQSLRRFNAAFRNRYRLSPSSIRRASGSTDPPRHGTTIRSAARAETATDLVRLTLAYRAPFAWDVLTALIGRDPLPGVEVLENGRYSRTVCCEDRCGVVRVEDTPRIGRGIHRFAKTQLIVDLSPSLLPALMPLLAKLRQMFDLDAEPTAVDSCLKQGGLDVLVGKRPGMRLPGALEGFEVVLRMLVRARQRSAAARVDVVRRVVWELGEPMETGHSALTRLAPTAERVAGIRTSGLVSLGVPARRAEVIIAVARAVTNGTVHLGAGSDIESTHRALRAIDGVDDRIATLIVMRALHWPDAFPASDRTLQRAAGASTARELLACAEQWRPWRSYAALHFWLQEESP